MSDAILAASSVVFVQCESFLEHQRQMQRCQGKDNAQTQAQRTNLCPLVVCSTGDQTLAPKQKP